MNILLDGAQKNIKLADFGICTIMEVRSCPLYVIYIFRYFIYLPHDYDNYKKMPKKKKNVGRDGEEA